MGSSTRKYLGKANTDDENRYPRKNYKRLPYAKKSTALEEYETDWLVTYKKYPGRGVDDVNSDFARHRNGAGGKSTISHDRIRASRGRSDILSKRR